VGLEGIVLIDLGTFVFAFGALLIVRIPRPPSTQLPSAEANGHRAGMLAGWRWLVRRPGLVALIALMAIFELGSGSSAVLAAPMILGTGSVQALGLVSSVGGVGMVLGGFSLALLPRSIGRIRSVFAGAALGGVGLVLYGLRPSLPFYLAGSFLFMLAVPILFGSGDVIWMSKVPPAMQGRVFALRDLAVRAMTPIACLVVAPLVDRTLVPLMTTADVPPWLVSLVGVGKARGAGLALVALGTLLVVAVLIGICYPRLRRLETQLPDASADATDPVFVATFQADDIDSATLNPAMQTPV
jgi:DHA3 family macrolide efflux protein-like MFS transporter